MILSNNKKNYFYLGAGLFFIAVVWGIHLTNNLFAPNIKASDTFLPIPDVYLRLLADFYVIPIAFILGLVFLIIFFLKISKTSDLGAQIILLLSIFVLISASFIVDNEFWISGNKNYLYPNHFRPGIDCETGTVHVKLKEKLSNSDEGKKLLSSKGYKVVSFNVLSDHYEYNISVMPGKEIEWEKKLKQDPIFDNVSYCNYIGPSRSWFF